MIRLKMVPIILASAVLCQLSFESNAQIIKQEAINPDDLANQHPAVYYVYAQSLMDSGKKDDAAFWFYTGQLRYRVHLKCKKSKKINTTNGLPFKAQITGFGGPIDSALFDALSYTTGQEINEWAFGDAVKLAQTVDKALLWDEENKNGYTKKKKCNNERKDVRVGLKKLQNHLIENNEEIKKTRTKNGLINR